MRRWMLGSVLAGLLLATLGLHCGGPRVSDTGFSGRWERRVGQSRSVVAIWDEDGALAYCWTKWTSGEKTVRCTGPGSSEVRFRGETIYRYTFRVREEAAQDQLTVDVTGEPLVDSTTPIRWVDRLILRPGGLELWSYQVELNGRPRATPAGPYRFVKISDRPR